MDIKEQFNFDEVIEDASKSFGVQEPKLQTNWIFILLMAFAGGLILNLMPCVLPVLSIKIISLARVKEKTRRLEAWFYTLGVVVSMLIVAALLLMFRELDNVTGWGFQMQSPWFVAIMLVVFAILALMMLDLITFNFAGINKLALLKLEKAI